MDTRFPEEIQLFEKAQTNDLVEELKYRLLNRIGRASEDARVDDHDLASILGPGPRTGCHGNTFVADVTITEVEAEEQGDGAVHLQLSYNGKYTRQGWDKGCIQGGREDHDLHGKVTLRVKQAAFKPVQLTWGIQSDVGDVSALDHDSNKFALAAVKVAVAGAF